MMMSMEILEEFSGSNDQMIVKGKRTKRPRSSYSASSSGGGGGCVVSAAGGEFYNNSFVSSPTTSSGISTSTEEDEDMANCLILLARGGSSPSPPAAATPDCKNSSRKFTEMATTTNGKVGIYVYECKTCNRTFPSFQALGGHRASHKKPKPTIDIDQKKSTPAAPPPPDYHQQQETRSNIKISTISPPPSPNKTFPPSDNKNKIHECSICGSEFASGQALGGHMRRHRSAPSTRIDTNVNDSSTSSHDVGEKTGRSMLELDLNLPAPLEDDGRGSEFQQFAASQKSRLVFSTAALVDCHY